MPNNIFLTRKCNLKCSYCFASEYFNNIEEEISIENFLKALSFIKRSSSQIGLIGGEPTLYSKFDEIIEILIKDKEIKNIYLYTNGLNIKNYEKLKHSKIKILINCNHPHEIGENNFRKLTNNIKRINKIKNGGISLGININENTTDYSYIFELLNLINLKIIRISYAISNQDKEISNNIIEEFTKIKPIIMTFYKQCISHKIIPNLDCNSLPYCILDLNDKKIIMEILEYTRKNRLIQNINIFPNSCTPVLDIFPDLTIGRCFSLSKYLRVNINDFLNLSEIEDYFISELDKYTTSILVDEKCNECKYRLNNKCNICLSYKIKEALKLKNIMQ